MMMTIKLFIIPARVVLQIPRNKKPELRCAGKVTKQNSECLGEVFPCDSLDYMCM